MSSASAIDKDAKYLKRKVKAGRLDVHPSEKALVVNYELEATILGEMGEPMLGERKQCQKIIRLKSLNPQTDVAILAREVIAKCKLIHPSKQAEVEQLLYYLQNRKELDSSGGGSRGGSAGSSSMQRYSPLYGDEEDQGNVEPANINNLDEYIELLYEEVASKVRGSALILRLARNPDNLEELSGNERLLGALSRVLREELKGGSVDLATNIIYVFFCFSTFSQFHPIVSHYKVGSLVMDIVDYEISRYQHHHEDYSRKKKKHEKQQQQDDEFEKFEKRFNVFVNKQEQALRVSFYLLLNLAEDPKVEEKMKKKHITRLLASVLRRSNEELLILSVSFLKKLSIYAENKEEMKRLGVVEQLAPLLASKNSDLVNAVVRLLLNLSFDRELRQRMVGAGMLPKLVGLLSTGEEEEEDKEKCSQNPVYCVLYHLSMEDKVKSMFTYTDAIPIVMRRILETTEEQVDLEVMALAINLAVNKRNSQLICEGHGLRVLMQRAFHYQDALIMKMIRNISQHDGPTKALFVEFVGDIADAVKRADLDEFRVECLGILGNLNLPELDYVRLLEEYELIPWMLERLRPGRSDDDLALEVVVFLGTCAADAAAARLVCSEGLLEAIIELLRAKQEDDEMVLQVVYVFHLLCSHEDTRRFILQKTDAVAYLIDLMHDKNSQVQKVCDATLDLIAQMDDDWAARVQREKFQFHNAQWLEMIHSQRRQQQHHHNGDSQQLFGNLHDDDDDVAGGGSGGGGGHFFGGLDDLEELVRETEALEELDNSDDSFTIDGAGPLMAPAATPGGGGRILDL